MEARRIPTKKKKREIFHTDRRLNQHVYSCKFVYAQLQHIYITIDIDRWMDRWMEGWKEERKEGTNESKQASKLSKN